MHWLILIILIGLVVLSILATLWRMNRGPSINRSKQQPRPRQPQKKRPDKVRENRARVEYADAQEDYEEEYEELSEATVEFRVRRWKIIIKEQRSNKLYDYVFVDSLGFGRVKDDSFERFHVVNDPKVSKVHCAIISQKDELYLVDKNSRNHTFFNGKQLLRPTIIQKDDIFTIGTTAMEVIKILREN